MHAGIPHPPPGAGIAPPREGTPLGVGTPPQQAPHPPGAGTPPPRSSAYGQQAGGMHPTGILLIFIRLVRAKVPVLPKNLRNN